MFDKQNLMYETLQRIKSELKDPKSSIGVSFQSKHQRQNQTTIKLKNPGKNWNL